MRALNTWGLYSREPAQVNEARELRETRARELGLCIEDKDGLSDGLTQKSTSEEE